MTEQHNSIFYNGKDFSGKEDTVAVEVALNISVNEIPFTVTMQTPGNEFDLAIGLLFTEGIFTNQTYRPKIEIISRNEDGHINSINIQLPQDLIMKDFAGTRNVISASSCGICGKTSLDDFDSTKIIQTEMLDPETVQIMFDSVSKEQQSFMKSGGTHAAGAFTLDGKLVAVREDIGRHNAVDKVIGYLIANNLMTEVKCLTVSGRVSFEIISKTKTAKIPFLAAVSAPSSLAIQKAEEAGITLMAFCRNNRFTIYSNPQRIRLAQNAGSTGSYVQQ